MAGWEAQGFERGWGGTGRTFLSHYKHLKPLGKHPTMPPARALGPAARVLLAGRCCRLIPDHHHRRRGMRCPERGSLSPRCSGWKPPPAPGAGGCTQQGHLGCGHRCRLGAACMGKEGEASLPLRECVLQLHVVLTAGRLPSSLGRSVVALCFDLKQAFTDFSPPGCGARGLGPSTGQVIFLPSCSSSPMPPSFLPHYIIGLPILPQISELLSKARYT